MTKKIVCLNIANLALCLACIKEDMNDRNCIITNLDFTSTDEDFSELKL